ncbi:paraneoplastic antigen Ma1 homolog [Rana temporaria]|uniref:paraneoplastic antigen Ma1 homolog n=1 Tax=Rana temporaria TaxID=8407 RepID=UPI001AADFA08|nr:paraneoplastic antigen Ma1 homolog [Rana temporaria]
MDPAAAVQWCEEEGTHSESSVVIELPGEAWAEEQISQAVKTLSLDRKAWVIAVKTDRVTSGTYALLECKQGIPENFKGASVQWANKTELCVIHMKVPEEGPTSSSQAESNKEEVPSPSPLATIGPELFAALGDFVSKCQRDPPTYSATGYRKLRVFSGRQPVPTGEDSFEEWLDQATQALDEWDIPETQKKQRITESLKGPASAAIHNLKLRKRNCVAQDYLNILQDVFGCTEKASDLIYQLEHTYQNVGEKLSEYMRRLDTIIHQILLKKGLDPQKVDEI